MVLISYLFYVLQLSIIGHAPLYLPLKYKTTVFYLNRGTVIVFNVICMNYSLIIISLRGK